MPLTLFPTSKEKQNHAAFEKTPRRLLKNESAVLLDLSFKGVSAIAILVIGFASIRFQQNLANTQQQTRIQDQQEQKYLPLFRGISEVDLALAEISAEFAMPNHTEEESIRANRLGTRLAYLVDSLYFPSDDFPGMDLIFTC